MGKKPPNLSLHSTAAVVSLTSFCVDPTDTSGAVDKQFADRVDEIVGRLAQARRNSACIGSDDRIRF